MLTLVLLADLLFLLSSLIYNDIFIVLYTSGLWLEFQIGIGWVVLRASLIVAAQHFSYPSILRVLIALELIVGVSISMIDVWVYFATNCECMLQVDGAILRLILRAGALVMYLRLLK